MTLEELLAAAKAAAEKNESFNLEAGVKAVVDAAVAAATEGVNTKNSELLGKLKASKAIVDSLPEDFSVDKWNEMIKTLSDVDIAKLKGDEALDALRKQLGEQHGKDLKAVQDENASLKSALETALIDNAATTAITEANGNAPLLLPHVKSHIQVQQGDDGVFSAIVIDPATKTERYSLTKPGEKMDISELIGEFKTKDTFAGAFSSGNRGGGTPPNGGRADGTPNPFVKGPDFSLTEQGKLMNTDPALAKRLQSEAEQAATQQ